LGVKVFQLFPSIRANPGPALLMIAEFKGSSVPRLGGMSDWKIRHYPALEGRRMTEASLILTPGPTIGVPTTLAVDPMIASFLSPLEAEAMASLLRLLGILATKAQVPAAQAVRPVVVVE